MSKSHLHKITTQQRNLIIGEQMAKSKSMGIGGIILGAGILFFILVFLLIGSIPFQLTGTEQAILYMASLLIMLSGLVIIITDM